MQTGIQRMDKQQDPTVEHKELYSIACDRPLWKEYEKEYMCIYIHTHTHIYTYWWWLSFSHSVVSDSATHGMKHTRLPCSSPSPGVFNIGGG